MNYDEYLRRWWEEATGTYFWAPRDTSNTFRSRPEPREGFIDARRYDGCVPLITTAPERVGEPGTALVAP